MPERPVKLTGREERVLEFIQSEIDAGRGFPDCGRITEHMGWKQATSARTTLQMLAGQGVLARWHDGHAYRYALPGAAVPPDCRIAGRASRARRAASGGL